MRCRYSILVSLALLFSSLLLASCSTTSSTPSASTTDTKPSGSLTMALSFEKSVIDPAQTSLSVYQAYGSAIIDSLVKLSPDGQVIPGIAERWEISADGKTHTFYIRKGVKFHNGDDLTGADVKFSIDRMLDPKAVHLDSAVWRGQIDKVELKDDFTVVISMKQPLFELLKGFADFSGAPAVVPKKYIEEKGPDNFLKNPIGSGPYRVLNWVPNGRLELEATESYWGGVPKFKNVMLIHTTEEATKVAMLKTGELDIAPVAPDSVSQLKAAGRRILGHDGGAQAFAYLFYDLDNPDKYALGDVRVRKALSLALNRKELADKIYGGYAEPSALFYARPTAFFWDPNVLKPDPFDPEGAKKLLAEAGYPNGFKTTITDMGGGGALTTVNLALAGYWRNVGVNAELAPTEFAVALARFSPKPAKYPAELFNSIFSYFSTGGVFQFEKMAATFHSTKSSPKNIRNPKIDELIDKVPLTKDPAEKKRLALEAAVLSMNEYSTLAFLDLQTIFALSSKIGQITPTKGMVGLGPSFMTMTHGK